MENARLRFLFMSWVVSENERVSAENDWVFSDTTQRENTKSYKAFSMVWFVYFIDTVIVEKPIFVHLTRVFKEPIFINIFQLKKKKLTEAYKSIEIAMRCCSLVSFRRSRLWLDERRFYASEFSSFAFPIG